jgi:hypothetical protein
MNDLLISIAKERIIPAQPGIIDYPNEHLESQLYRMSVYITQNILHSYYLIFRWNKHEETALTLALRNSFPKSWLELAEQSPQHYLDLQKTFTWFKINLSEQSIKRIHKIVEFLCYELIETSVIYSNFLPIQQISPLHLKQSVETDITLKHIIQRHNIILTDQLKLKSNALTIQSPIPISNKAQKLIRIYIEELVKHLLTFRYQDHKLTVEDVEFYIKVYSLS